MDEDPNKVEKNTKPNESENPETGSWTIAFYSLKNHQTCVIMAGQSSTHIVSKLKGSKS